MNNLESIMSMRFEDADNSSIVSNFLAYFPKLQDPRPYNRTIPPWRLKVFVPTVLSLGGQFPSPTDKFVPNTLHTSLQPSSPVLPYLAGM